jgi:hypothetical protein
MTSADAGEAEMIWGSCDIERNLRGGVKGILGLLPKAKPRCFAELFLGSVTRQLARTSTGTEVKDQALGGGVVSCMARPHYRSEKGP